MLDSSGRLYLHDDAMQMEGTITQEGYQDWAKSWLPLAVQAQSISDPNKRWFGAAAVAVSRDWAPPLRSWAPVCFHNTMFFSAEGVHIRVTDVQLVLDVPKEP